MLMAEMHANFISLECRSQLVSSFLFWIILPLLKLTLTTFAPDRNIFPSTLSGNSKAAWVLLQFLLCVLMVVACRSLHCALLILFEVSGESSRDGGKFFGRFKARCILFYFVTTICDIHRGLHIDGHMKSYPCSWRKCPLNRQ